MLRKIVLIPLVLGVIFLIIGGIQSYSSSHASIHSWGYINPYNGQPELPQTAQTTQLDITGFLAILVSISFFTVVYFNSRR